MIKAIIFDCFGVLVTENWFRFKDTFFGDDPERGRKAAELMDQANAGLLTMDQFVDELAALAGVEGAEVRKYLDGNARDDQLLSFIAEELKPQYKIGMLSNASANFLQRMLTDEQRALFDAIDLSYESGIAKPSELAYVHIAEKLSVAPEECIFIDDQERHCSGAKDTGMRAIEYKNFTSLKADLGQLLHLKQ
jgi:FMN phosphatase YigB (HAD superfamily)